MKNNEYKFHRENNKKKFNSVADSVKSIKTRKERLSNEVFNNPDFCWELAKIKASYRENKMSLDFSNSVSARHIVSERDSMIDNVFKDEPLEEDVIKHYSQIEEGPENDICNSEANLNVLNQIKRDNFDSKSNSAYDYRQETSKILLTPNNPRLSIDMKMRNNITNDQVRFNFI